MRKENYDNKENRKQKEKKKLVYATIGASILLIAFIAVTFYAIQTGKQKEEEMSLPYTELIKNISDDTVEKIEMKSGSNVVDVKLRDIEEEKQTRVPNLQAFTEYVQRKVEEGSQIEVDFDQCCDNNSST